MELAAIPQCLFLDEPTSGLDSTAALSVTEILKSIASLGQSVICVLHQPRIEIFQQLDDIVLIVPGGKIAYIGPAQKCQPYFESQGYSFPAGSNPADVFMDILSDESASGVLPQRWISYVEFFEAHGRDPSLAQSEALFFKNVDEITKTRGAWWISQVYYCVLRYGIQQVRSTSSLALEILVALASGFLMGISVASNKGELFKGIYIAPFSILSPAPLYFIIPLYGLLIGFSVALSGLISI